MEKGILGNYAVYRGILPPLCSSLLFPLPAVSEVSNEREPEGEEVRGRDRVLLVLGLDTVVPNQTLKLGNTSLQLSVACQDAGLS